MHVHQQAQWRLQRLGGPCPAMPGVDSRGHPRDRFHEVPAHEPKDVLSAGRAVALRERGARAAVPVQLHAVVLDLGRRPPDRLRLPHLRLLRLARGGRGHLQKGKTDLVSGDFAWCSAKTKYGFQFGRILVQVLFDHIALAVQEFGPGRDRSEMQLSCRLMNGCSQGMLV